MKTYTVVFTPEAAEQVTQLYRYISKHASQAVALRYARAILDHCLKMRSAPYRGTRRDDIRPGLRITNFRRRAAIAFAIDAEFVVIIGIFYGGQDYEATLRADA